MVTQSPLPFSSCSAFRSAQTSLQQLVDQLTETKEIALARIWLIQSGDLCEICKLDSDTAGSSSLHLHLTASAGRSQDATKPEVWDRLGGAFHRFPLNGQKIGRIAATGEAMLVHHSAGATVLAHPDWIAREGIQSFFGYPLTFEDRIFGVMAVFSRLKLKDWDVRFLRQIADGGARLLEDAARISQQSHELQKLTSENGLLREELAEIRHYGSLIACGPASRKLESQINMAAAHDKPVLITGERGTGKELTARLIHARSPDRRTNPFVTVAGASLTCELLESVATTGTVLIRAVEQMPIDLQERLARSLVLTSTSVVRSGFPAVPTRARVIATSNADLQSEVAAGRFRHDLYCELSVVEIEVPSLRQRFEDLPALATEIVEKVCRRENRPSLALDLADLAQLKRYDWPGNVRELQLVLECAVSQARDGQLSLSGLLHATPVSEPGDADSSFVRSDELKRQERTNIIACLQQCHWKVYGPGGAAELLGIKPTTLLYRMKVHRIRKPSSRKP